MDIFIGIVFIAVGAFSVLRTDDYMRLIRKDPINRRFFAWLDQTAYGRWASRFEPSTTRFTGLLIAGVGAFMIVVNVAGH